MTNYLNCPSLRSTMPDLAAFKRLLKGRRLALVLNIVSDLRGAWKKSTEGLNIFVANASGINRAAQLIWA